MKKLLLISFLPVLCSGVYAQNATLSEKINIGYEPVGNVVIGTDGLDWTLSINGEAHDNAHDIIATSKGNILVAGDSWSKNYFANHRGQSDAFLMMLNKSGNVIWKKTYGTTDEDQAQSICEFPNGNLVVAGMSECLYDDGCVESHLSYAWVFCVDENGNDVWSEKLDYVGTATHIAVGTDGSLMVAASDGTSVTLINLSASGEENWRSVVAPNFHSRPHGFVGDNEGNYYLSGSTYHSTFNSGEMSKWVNDSWLKKLDAMGEELWSIPIGNHGINLCGEMLQTKNGNLLIPVSSENGGDFGCGSSYDFSVVHISPDGQHVGDDCYGEETIEQPRALSLSLDGSVWMLGDALRYDDLEFGPNYQRDIWLQQVNEVGEVIDVMNSFSLENDLSASVLALPGQVIVVSNTQVKTEFGYQDDAVITSHKTANSINLVSEQPELIATPEQLPIISSGDLLVDERDLRSENLFSSVSEVAFALTVYPNPANSTITISSNEKIRRIRILDNNGRVVMNSRCSDVMSCELDISDLASGLYQVEVKTENERIVKPLIKE
ncbi:MAG: T9SS type A sorting domain-containing protein [Flavobacteriales bacterium]|nr:T9SS type A sorting domain-containing protein [Flavobacteriales bacterium]